MILETTTTPMPVQQNEVPECASKYLASIGSVGGKNGSHAAKVKAGKKSGAVRRKKAKLTASATGIDDRLAIKK